MLEGGGGGTTELCEWRTQPTVCTASKRGLRGCLTERAQDPLLADTTTGPAFNLGGGGLLRVDMFAHNKSALPTEIGTYRLLANNNHSTRFWQTPIRLTWLAASSAGWLITSRAAADCTDS
jgi:hypothetical protein